MESLQLARKDEAGILSHDQIARFHREGHVAVKALFDESEVRALAAWTDELHALPEVPGKYMKYFEDAGEPGKRMLCRVENFYPYHAGFAALFDGPKLRGAASQLFGEAAVLFKDKINFKLPGGGGFAPHQDVQAGWDRYASLHISVLVSIDEATIANGCLELARGCHDRGLIGDMWSPLTEEQMRGLQFRPFPTRPGDAVFFDSFVPHSSMPNHSADPRRVLYATYNRLSEGDWRERYYADKRRSYPPDCEREPGKAYVFRV